MSDPRSQHSGSPRNTRPAPPTGATSSTAPASESPGLTPASGDHLLLVRHHLQNAMTELDNLRDALGTDGDLDIGEASPR